MKKGVFYGNIARLRDFQLKILQQVSQVAISPFDFNRILDTMMDLIITVMHTDAGSVILQNEDTGLLEFRVTKGEKAEEIKKYKLKAGEGIAGWVFKNKKPVIANDVTKDKRFKGSISREIKYETHNILCTPLLVKNRIIGILEVINKKSNDLFIDDDLRLLKTLANNISIVIENAHLFDTLIKKIKELNTISEVSRNINSILDLDPLLNVVMENATQVMKAEASSVLLLDEEKRELIFRVALGEKGKTVKKIRLNVGEGIAGWVAKTGKPMIVNNVGREPRFNPKVDEKTGFKTRSIICVPLLLKEKMIGVIQVINKHESLPFTKEDEGLLNTFACHAAIAIENAKLYESIREEERKRGIYQRFLSPQVVDEIMNKSKTVSLGGRRQNVTILFSDIRGFTEITEAKTPEYIVDLLNEYFAEMIDIIFKYGGTLDKFIGDGLMAIFGAPIDYKDHAIRGVAAALEMRDRLRELNKKKRKRGYIELSVGIGINTGSVVAGNIGSEKRMEYTVIGNEVNIASRLEGIAQGGQILITEKTYRELKGIKLEAEKLKQIQVKGKEGAMNIYHVKSIKGKMPALKL
ncbi:MAG: GAF domain-containing protein [Nitrospinae bacterium]|nr:GAF domain-containing protein [Nitrospinota bacterium]